MKKARIVLTAVLILGTTAGILAWHARKYMAEIYYTCNTRWMTCAMTWTLGSNMTTLYTPVATLTVYNASPFTQAWESDCEDWCTYSNHVYIEPGY